jgi:uncharacterized protein YbaR (Trm112 family)/SAM-dependent methyltransferase
LKRRLLDWLACPSCGGSLALTPLREDGEDVAEGVLVCPCTAAFPVIEGVPRLLEGALLAHGEFVGRWEERLRTEGILKGRALDRASPEFEELIAPTRDRFGKEWGEHPLEETTWGLDQETRLAHALRYLGWTRGEARGRLVLDAGCGTAKLTCGMASWGGEVVGLDLQASLVRGWRARHRWAGAHADRVHLVQGSVLAPPFRKGVFDGLHSAGVLHHTPDTRRAVAAVAPLVKAGGSMGIWLYREGRMAGRLPWLPFVRARWASIPGSWLRPVTTRMAPGLLFWLLWAYAAVFHVLYSVAARIRGRRHGQTIRERTTSLFDTFAPPFVWHHTVSETCGWYREEGFPDPVETTVEGDVDGFCVTGRRAR